MEKREREIVLKALKEYKNELKKDYEENEERYEGTGNYVDSVMSFLEDAIEKLEEEEIKERAYDEKKLLTRLIAEDMANLSELYSDLEYMINDKQVPKEEIEQVRKEIDELERRTEKLIDEIKKLSI